MGVKRVIVHIGRLVLKGFRHEDRHALAEGLREELGRQFAESTASPQLVYRGDMPRLRVAGVRIEHEAKPAVVGAQVAQGVARRIKP